MHPKNDLTCSYNVINYAIYIYIHVQQNKDWHTNLRTKYLIYTHDHYDHYFKQNKMTAKQNYIG